MADWQATIDEIHSRGMYLMADFTVGTMGDMIGFEGCVYMQWYRLAPPLILFQIFEYIRSV